MSQTTVRFFEFEIPILEALAEHGGEASVSKVYDWIRKNKSTIFEQHPEILGRYKEGHGQIIWQNKIRWAREYMKRKGQLEFPRRGIWKLSRAGYERLVSWRGSSRDPDAGLETIFELPEEKPGEPEKAFEVLEHTHGAILGVNGIPIVYEPINEQGVILLFTALASKLGFLIVSIRPQFPDALLAKREQNGRYRDIKAEFEFKASSYRIHNHPLKGCDLIVCWENDWKGCPIEQLELKAVTKKFVVEK